MKTNTNSTKIDMDRIDEEFEKFLNDRKTLRNYQNWRGTEKAAKKRKKNRR